ncbi:MAG TPA: cache domain-containing protein [Stellaceae bacterium]|nr:cache domain-containing protein [Stellaceae bacterium]
MLLLSGVAWAGTERGTPDEAKAMAIRAAALLKEDGPDKAFAEFAQPAFHDRDLYVMVYDDKGNCLFHGANPVLVGKNLLELKDTNGKLTMHEFVAVQDAAWVEYSFADPVTKKVAPKATYVIRVGHDLVGVGAYK